MAEDARQELDELIVKMTVERAAKRYEEGDLEAALDNACFVYAEYPDNVELRAVFGRYFREYIIKTGGMPDDKAIQIYESELIPMKPNFTVYRLFISKIPILHNTNVALLVYKVTNTLIDTTALYVICLMSEHPGIRFIGPSNTLFSAEKIADYYANGLANEAKPLPAYAALRIATKPTKYKLYVGMNEVYPIICHEQEERLVIVADKSIPVELRKSTGAEIPPINRTTKQVEYWLGEKTVLKDEAA